MLDPPPYLLCRFALLCYSIPIACLLSPPYLLCLFYFALLFHPCLNRTPLPIVPRPAGTQLGVMNRRMDVLRGKGRESGEKCKFIVCLTGAMCISGACWTGAYRGWHTCGCHVCMGNPYLFTCIYSIATGPLILVSFKGRHVVFTVPMGHVNKGMVKKVKLAP